MENNTTLQYDVIIVGGGSAGATMASRLSEDNSRNVLLLVKLVSTDPLVAPTIVYNMLKESSDMKRMTEAVKISRSIGLNNLFGPVKQREMFPGESIATDAELIKAICEQIDSYQHPTSTVPMGLESDPDAVVDGWGSVYGVQGLRVVDASIMPYIVSAPPNVTTVMMAEHIFRNISGLYI